MAVSKQQKEQTLAQIEKDLSTAKGVVFTEYRGLSVKDMEQVRQTLREENVSYKVIKVTLLKKALAKLGISIDNLTYNGPMAIAISQDEETAPARLLKLLGKKHDKLVIDGGVFNQEVVGSDVIQKLASLPTKDQLLGQLASVIAGPARGLVTVLSGNTRNLLYALNAIAEQKK